MSKKELLLDYLDRNNGMITYKDCKKIGIPTIYLSRLENEGVIFRIAKGIYLSANGDYDEYYFFQYTSLPFIYRDLQMKFHNILK